MNLQARKILGKLCLHSVLIAGSFLFAVPFIWLFSTSCKQPDEMYPPKWIPELPSGVRQSPYIQLRANERPQKPTNVALEDWNRNYENILSGIKAQVGELRGSLPDFFAPYLEERDLAEGIFNRLLKRAPDEIFQASEQEAATWFSKNVTQEMVSEVFETVYRRMAVSDVVLHGWDVVSVEYPTANQNFPWRVISGDAELVPRMTGLLRPNLEVHYSFKEKKNFALQIVLPLHMPSENLKKLVVSLQGDRSWHEIWATVELAGKKYESVEAAYLQSDRAQDITWQFPSEDDDRLKMKTWLSLQPTGLSDFTNPHALRLTLTCRYGSRLIAGFNKIFFNYRDAVRRVPLLMYVKNSIFLVVLSVIGQIIGSSLVAFSFARLRWPGREFCFLLVLSTLMIPPQVTMIPVFLIYKNIGWYNTLLPLWVPSFFGGGFFHILAKTIYADDPGRP